MNVMRTNAKVCENMVCLIYLYDGNAPYFLKLSNVDTDRIYLPLR